MSRPFTFVRRPRDACAGALRWLQGGLLGLVVLGAAHPDSGRDLALLASAAGLAPVPVFSLIDG